MKIVSPEPPGGYQCVWSTLSKHPKCPHGPTLLFGINVEGDYKQFYACSACRDRKLCAFYLEEGNKLTKQQIQTWELKKKEVLPRYDHQKMFIRLNELLAESPARRMYCHTCERLSFISERHKHRDHDVTENLTDRQLSHPTEILKPLENPKKEAQYLFSQKATKDIIDMLVTLGAKNILCIGAPRIHEYIVNNLDDKVSSLLLDFDGRFHNFFGPLNYCWYNLFNNHFFNEDSKDVFKDFLTQNGGKDTYIVCDPPFGGRVEPMSQTLKTIHDLHKKWNEISDENDELKTMFIFPYYMESTLRDKSNPVGISGGLKELKMSDYKVDYDNHPLFARSEDRKIGSQVRIFTDIDLNLLKLPETDGYKYCKRCKKWTSAENKHCKKCKECTSKDGRRYRHCNACSRCVKPTWKHCKRCDRCALETHKCGEVPKITGRCYKCNEFGHVEKLCTKGEENFCDSNGKSPKGKKRKSEDKNGVPNSKKKARVEDTNEMPKVVKKRLTEEDESVSDATEIPRVAKVKTIKSKKLMKLGSASESNKLEKNAAEIAESISAESEIPRIVKVKKIKSKKLDLDSKSKKLKEKTVIGSTKKAKLMKNVGDTLVSKVKNIPTLKKNKPMSNIDVETRKTLSNESLGLNLDSTKTTKHKKIKPKISNEVETVKFVKQNGKIANKRIPRQKRI